VPHRSLHLGFRGLKTSFNAKSLACYARGLTFQAAFFVQRAGEIIDAGAFLVDAMRVGD
jgi:hypothetical protein